MPGCGNDKPARVVVLTGADTGGGTISVPICGTRTLPGPPCSAGAGGTMPTVPEFIAIVDCMRSRWMSGAGATTCPFKAGRVRLDPAASFGDGGTIEGLNTGKDRFAADWTSGGGATIEFVEFGSACSLSRATSGEGGTTAACGSAGALEWSPDVGGGPGVRLIASRFATGRSDLGIFSLGTSTTFSVGELPRATRMVCVR